MFEAEGSLLKDRGVLIETPATQPDSDNCITLTVENHSLESVCLDGGCVLGNLQPVTLLQDTEGEPAETTEQGIVRAFPFVKHQTGSQPTQEVPKQPETMQMAECEEALCHALQLESVPLRPEEGRQLKEMVLEYADMFALNPSELGTTDMVQHVIDTGDNHPVRQPPRCIPFALRGKVEEMVDDMLQHGIVKPSKSPWASPIVLVAKQDGATRFCVDYCRLNAVTKMDVFPLPRINDSLTLLAHCKYFTTLDLATGYWQVEMDPVSQEKTAFCTHSGLYEFTVMPFGLCNAPATFQRLMESVLAGLARDTCLVYIDDILVLGRTFEEHLQNLEKVFDRLREAACV